jgi:hypothetical protein
MPSRTSISSDPVRRRATQGRVTPRDARRHAAQEDNSQAELSRQELELLLFDAARRRAEMVHSR